MVNDLDRARDALQHLDPGCDRDTWVKVGMAYHAAGGDLDTFDTWSAGADSYRAADCRDTWRSFKAVPGGVGAGTLFALAHDAGWQDDRTDRPFKPAPERSTRPPEPPQRPAPDPSIKTVWSRLQTAPATHPYALRKQLCSETMRHLRVVADNDPLTAYRGWLAVPGYSADGTLTMVEFVAPDGTKRSLKGSIKTGAMFTVGPDSGPLVVNEGLGGADAAFASSGGRAVSTFGCGNTRAVVEVLCQREPHERIIIVPDSGKESAAEKIAAEFGCLVATMPPGWVNNSDLNDVFCSADGGFDLVQRVLEAASEPPRPEPKVHPLARYVDVGGTPTPPRWVIPGFIGHGVAVISGAHGVGKTTALLPLAMTAAALHGDDLLLPRQWRHVIYVTEDLDQARRIVAGIVGDMGLDIALVRERLHLVEAVRLDPVFVASVGATYREQFTRNVGGVEVLPLVVLDTKSAVLAVESENDNSEASRMMAALKQGFDGLPVWLIGHLSKATMSRADALSNRGASATEADANQTLFLVQEGECRYLVRGKTRFDARWPELEIVSHTSCVKALDEFGNVEDVLLRWGVAAPATTSRKEAADKAAEEQQREDATALRNDIRDAVAVAWGGGNPLNRAGVKAKVRRKTSEVVGMMENLLNERWLIEVDVPAKLRIVNSKAAYLAPLTTEEHEAVLAGAALPADKLVIPQSWQKQAVSPVPAPVCETAGETL